MDRTPIEDIRTGDQFVSPDGRHIWTALRPAISGGQNPHTGEQLWHLDVQYADDGGCETRVFIAGHALSITR